MEKHISVVAALRIGFGALSILTAFVVFTLFLGIGMITNDSTAFGILALIGGLSSLVLLLLGLPNILGGIGLIGHKSWARYLVLVLCVIDLMNVPVGTLAGAYGLYVLVQDETVTLFQRDQTTVTPDLSS